MGCMDVLWLEYILLGLALSADACSVSLVYGSRLQPFRWRQAMVPALAFGIAQGLMPVVGWLGGALLASFIGRSLDSVWDSRGAWREIHLGFPWGCRHQAGNVYESASDICGGVCDEH